MCMKDSPKRDPESGTSLAAIYPRVADRVMGMSLRPLPTCLASLRCYHDIVQTKQQLRERIWETLQRWRVARFPGAVGRILNFDGTTQAAAALRALADRLLVLGDLETGILERAAAGYGGRNVTALIEQARGLARQHDTQARAARAVADSRPTLEVLAPFRGPGGHNYPPGTHRISPEEAQELEAWASQTTHQADQHGGYESVGFPSWPVFVLQDA